MVLLFSLTKPLGKNGGFPGEDFEALCQGEVGIHEEQFLVLQGGGLCFLRPGIGSKMAGIIWDFSAQIENFHIFFGETGIDRLDFGSSFMDGNLRLYFLHSWN